MKITLAILSGLLLSTTAFSRGVYLQCISVGYNYLTYSTDGGYIHDTLLNHDGKDLEIKKDSEECIDWDFPAKCVNEITTTTGEAFRIELEVVKEKLDKDGLFEAEVLFGTAKPAKGDDVSVICVREAL